MWRAALPLLLCLNGGALGAQVQEPYLPLDHWTRSALLQLAGLDAIPSLQAVRAGPLRRDEVRRLLSMASMSADPSAARTARAQLRAFETEFLAK